MSDEGSGDDEKEERSSLFERAVPEALRRLIEGAVEKGVEKISEGPENLRHFLGDFKLPKEVLAYLFTQIDDTKKGLYRVVAKEIRDVLEHTNFADEIADLLTKLSFEVSMQVRFVPNTAAKEARAEEAEHAAHESAGTAAEGDEAHGGSPAGTRHEAHGHEGAPHHRGDEPDAGKTKLRPQIVSKVVMKAREKLGERRPKE